MKVLIAGGRGFLGSALVHELKAAGHEAVIMSRGRGTEPNHVHWDGEETGPWIQILDEVDAVVNCTGYGLEHWPWSQAHKRRFAESRIGPGQALANAIRKAPHRPQVFIQYSGINHYGLQGNGIADESTPPGSDFLAQLTVQWEASSAAVGQAGLRWIAVRNGIVLDAKRGLLPKMILPVRMFVGGRLGVGTQPVPWIHVKDHTAAVRFLLENPGCSGAYNLVAPATTSSDEFLQAAARVLRRPYWVSVPAAAVRGVLGQMSELVLQGRYANPRRLLETGYQFAFADIESALADLFTHPRR